MKTMSPFVAMASLEELSLSAVLNRPCRLSTDPRYEDWKRLYRCLKCCRHTSTVVSLETLAFCVMMEDTPTSSKQLNKFHQYDDWRSRVFRCHRCLSYFPMIYCMGIREFGDHNCYPQCAFCYWEWDIELVTSQTSASREKCVKALIRRRGDLVDAIIDLIDP